MEPPVSVPMAKPTSPAAGAAPEPAEEPLDPIRRIPRTIGAPAEPLVAERELARRQLRDQNGPRFRKALDDGRIHVEDLRAKGLGSPSGRIAFRRDDVLAAPGNPVERAEVPARGDLGVGAPRLRHRQVLRESYDAVQERVVLLEPREIHLSELDGRCLSRSHQLREMGQRPERRLLEVRRPLDRGRSGRARKTSLAGFDSPGTSGLK